MDFWKRLLLALLFLPLALHEAQALCPPIWPRVTFLQLYEGDLQKDTRDWQRAFRRWQALGTEEVILQWSAYGAPEGGPFPLVQEGLIPLLLDIAAEEGMELRLGLRYDPDLWQRREHHEPDRQSTATAGAPSELSRYFFRRQQDHEALLQLLAPLAAHPAFAGWYITDEIDDVTWREPAGRRRLQEYLRETVSHLRHVDPGAGIAISGFSNGIMPPLEWGEFWQELLTGSDIDHLLFQDGIGAEKLELEELAYYLSALSQALAEAGKDFDVIIELFGPPAAEGFKTAPIERIEEQLLQAARFSRRPVTFALPHHALPPHEGPLHGEAAAGQDTAGLARELLQLQSRCGF